MMPVNQDVFDVAHRIIGALTDAPSGSRFGLYPLIIAESTGDDIDDVQYAAQALISRGILGVKTYSRRLYLIPGAAINLPLKKPSNKMDFTDAEVADVLRKRKTLKTNEICQALNLDTKKKRDRDIVHHALHRLRERGKVQREGRNIWRAV